MTDTATRAGLAALEPLRPVIDPEGKLNKKTKTDCYQSRSDDNPTFSMPVWPEDALAHLEKKAREWIEKWCRERQKICRYEVWPQDGGVVTHAIQIGTDATGQGDIVQEEYCDGYSWPEALANTIAALQKKVKK